MFKEVITMKSLNEIKNNKDFNHNLEIVNYSSSIFSKIVDFNNKVLDAFNKLEKDGCTVYSEDYEYINELNYSAYKKLNVETYQEYSKIVGAIGISEMLVNQGIEDNDVECLTEGLYTLGQILNELNVFDKEDNYVGF